MKIIGLMSGTSVDGIDAALVDVSGDGYAIEAELIQGVTHPYPEEVRSQILSLCADEPISLSALAELDDAIAHHFVQAVRALEVDLSEVDLIGSHGQTLHHRPPAEGRLGHTLQLGRGDLIAHETGCPTVSNFRVADIALGGQGAPLVSIVDACLLSQFARDITVQNIGGIGNVTYLPHWNRARSPNQLPQEIKGWDTGPGNALIDWAVTYLSNGQKTYDENGEWAASGKPMKPLIEQWLEHPFFQKRPPKSTGRELFGAEYAQARWQEAQQIGLSPTDFITTITDFTAATIELSYRKFLPCMPIEAFISGGGSRNAYLMKRLQQRMLETTISSTESRQLDADYKEAIAFAILAYWRICDIPGNLPSVTGATRPCLLGELWRP